VGAGNFLGLARAIPAPFAVAEAGNRRDSPWYGNGAGLESGCPLAGMFTRFGGSGVAMPGLALWMAEGTGPAMPIVLTGVVGGAGVPAGTGCPFSGIWSPGFVGGGLTAVITRDSPGSRAPSPRASHRSHAPQRSPSSHAYSPDCSSHRRCTGRIGDQSSPSSWPRHGGPFQESQALFATGFLAAAHTAHGQTHA